MKPKGRLRLSFIFLPNLITLFNLFTGFLSLVMTARGRISVAATLILIALIWDSLDGNIARMFKNPSDLGRELDSLADIVSFVVAPAFLVGKFLLMHISPWMLLFLFLYLGCGAYRLARFNLLPPRKDYFEGLPTPAAAVVLSMSILACLKNGWTDLIFFSSLAISLLILLSFLMISHIHYPKLSAVKFVKWQSFFYLNIVVFLGIRFFFNVETALTAVSGIFLFLAPIYCLPAHAYGDPKEATLSSKHSES